ncbi:MAG: hypothetical protein JWP75_1696 [Frondihabitans sp.]|nr:hypothetical protein [Frondihabitans sp.]
MIAALGVPAAASAAPAATLPTRGLSYVALGDSYAAGYGLTDPTDEPVSGCGQSAHDYPHQVAANLGLDLTDVTCAGATTANVIGTKQLGAAPQSNALGRDTKVVTISIGGNDAGLFATASSCIALSKTGPIFAHADHSTCKSTLVTGGVDSLTAAIDGRVTSDLAKAFATISRRAPDAHVFVIGYPAIFPDKAHMPPSGCFRPVVDAETFTGIFPKNGFPFTDTDVAYLGGVQKELDAATRKAADHAGFTYVSTLASSEAHSGCATSDSYIQGITLTGTTGLRSISLKPGALHPNARGAAFLAAQTAAAITASYASPSTSTPGPTAQSGHIEVLWIGVVAALVVLFVILATLSRGRRRRLRRQQQQQR